MNTQEALDIRSAISTLSDALGISFKDVAARICFFDKGKSDILVKASDLWSKFFDANIVERGKMLGLTITHEKQGAE